MTHMLEMHAVTCTAGLLALHKVLCKSMYTGAAIERSMHLGSLLLPILGKNSSAKQLAAATGPCAVILPWRTRQGKVVIYLCRGLQLRA